MLGFKFQKNIQKELSFHRAVLCQKLSKRNKLHKKVLLLQTKTDLIN